MRELALFAGSGGGLLGTHHLLGWRTVCAVELDPYRVDVLGARQRDGFLGSCPFPIHGDIRDFDGTAWRGRVDVISAGFPCQPFSGAGKRLGADDPRNMWPETARVIREVRPRFVFLENSPKLASAPPRHAVIVAILDLLGGRKRVRLERLFNPGGYLGTVLADLAASGFNAEWDCFSASAIGAPHRRDRLWILAYSPEGGLEGREPGQGRSSPGLAWRRSVLQSERPGRGVRGLPDADGIDVDAAGHGAGALQRERWEAARLRGGLPDADSEKLRDEPGRRSGTSREGEAESSNDGSEEHVAHTDGERREEGDRDNFREGEPLPANRRGWPPEPRLGRIAPHGMADRLVRVEAIGDGQVPGVAALAWTALARRAGLDL